MRRLTVSSAVGDPKQNKREARQLKERADAAMAAGDYRAVRELCLKAAALAPETDVGAEANACAGNLRTDPWTLYGGLLALLLYSLAWAYALA